MSFIRKFFPAALEKAASKAEARQSLRRDGWYRVKDIYAKKGNSITEYHIVFDPTPLPGDPPPGDPAP